MGNDPYLIDKPFSVDDRQLDEYLDRIAFNFNASRGVQIGPFDHPEGVLSDEPFTVEHDLGEVPEPRLITEDPGTEGKGVYATRADRDKWTKTSITVRSPAENNTGIIVRVLGRQQR